MNRLRRWRDAASHARQACVVHRLAAAAWWIVAAVVAALLLRAYAAPSLLLPLLTVMRGCA